MLGAPRPESTSAGGAPGSTQDGVGSFRAGGPARGAGYGRGRAVAVAAAAEASTPAQRAGRLLLPSARRGARNLRVGRRCAADTGTADAPPRALRPVPSAVLASIAALAPAPPSARRAHRSHLRFRRRTGNSGRRVDAGRADRNGGTRNDCTPRRLASGGCSTRLGGVGTSTIAESEDRARGPIVGRPGYGSPRRRREERRLDRFPSTVPVTRHDDLTSESSNSSEPAPTVATPAGSPPPRALAPQAEHVAEAQPRPKTVAETPEAPETPTKPPASGPDRPQNEPVTSPPATGDTTQTADPPVTDPALPAAPMTPPKHQARP